jgi:hypothetical protein
MSFRLGHHSCSRYVVGRPCLRKEWPLIFPFDRYRLQRVLHTLKCALRRHAVHSRRHSVLNPMVYFGL